MKKQILKLLVVFLTVSFFSDYAMSIGNDTKPKREVMLTAEKSKPKKSVSPIPNITAYLNASGIEICFNEAIAQNVSIVITANNNEVVYSETIQVSSPVNHPISIDFEDDSSYQLDIFTADWYFYGNF